MKYRAAAEVEDEDVLEEEGLRVEERYDENDSPPVPVAVGSPVWAMKFLETEEGISLGCGGMDRRGRGGGRREDRLS